MYCFSQLILTSSHLLILPVGQPIPIEGSLVFIPLTNSQCARKVVSHNELDMKIFIPITITLSALCLARADRRQEVPIAGIFEAGSVGESAFSFAVYAYNKNSHNPFYLLPKLSILTPPHDALRVMDRFCDLVSDNVLAVFVSELAFDEEVNRVLTNTAAALQIPLITTADGRGGVFTRNLMPTTKEALAEVLVHENWTAFAYLTTSMEGVRRLGQLVGELKERGSNLSLTEVTVHYVGVRGMNERELQGSLVALDGALKKRVTRRVVVDSRVVETNQLMRMFSRMGMNRGEYEFLFASLNVADTDLVDYIYSGVKLAGYRLMDPERADVKQFAAEWTNWNSRSSTVPHLPPIASTTTTNSPPFYHAALMADAVGLFTSTLHCRLQQMEPHRANASLAELTAAALQMRQQPSLSGGSSKRNGGGRSSCYLGGRLMYQHGAYQVRGLGVIADLRRHFVTVDVDDGCGDIGLRGLTGDLRTSVEEREARELVLWSAMDTVGLQPVARWSSTTHLDFEAFKPPHITKDPHTTPEPSGDSTGSERLPQVWEEDFDPSVVIDRQRLADYHNRTIRVVTIWSKPFVQPKPRKLGAPEAHGIDGFEGFCVDLLEEISKIVGFKYDIHIVYDGIFGTKIGEMPPQRVEVLSRRSLSNLVDRRVETRRLQVWNGLIGEILNNTADLVMAPLTVNYLRAQVVEFSEPFLAFGLSLIIKKPGKQKSGSLSFLRPLSNAVWFAVFGAWITVSLGLYVIARISPTEWQVTTDPVTGRRHCNRRFTLGNSVWISFAAFVQQGVDFSPRAPGTRIVIAVWWFVTLILIAFYTANLAAFLTISLRVPPINSWNDLLKSDMEYGSLKSGSTRDFFFNTKLEPFAQLGAWMKRNAHALANNLEEGVDRVRSSKGKYAFVLESVMNEYVNNREPCDTMMAGSAFGNYGYGIALPRRSPMREVLSDAVLRLRESQVLANLRKKWWIERGQCSSAADTDRSAADALALINVAGVFHILVGGLLLALLVAAVELVWHMQWKQRGRWWRQRSKVAEVIGKSTKLGAEARMGGNEVDPWTMQMQ
ncbi:Glutamate receptor 3 [Echinococcus granulosus]|uniref:Glutamate receptor ionotrophic AMPA 3 n=1 Tax=Echinococcus granulosus TaxID=6210 RepID=A0A068WUB2_ECHGR|nr:Glutamate receptor 3 [Echinococcus granulosus]CDS21262.1 glutamate receptor ionotrophic AMPA 3 [Echinococcus granulosus]